MNLDASRELGQQLLESQPDTLRSAAGIGENQRGSERGEQRRKLFQRSTGGIARGRIGIFSQRRKHLDDRFLLRGRPNDFAGTTGSAEEFSDGFERRDRGRQTDATERHVRLQRLQPLRRYHEMRAAFVLGERVNFIDDQEAARAQGRQPASLAEKQRQAFRRGDENMRRLSLLRGAVLLRCVAGAKSHAHVIESKGEERARDVLLQIVGKRAERRDINGKDLVRQLSLCLRSRAR